MPVIYSNNASTSLSSGINNSTTTIPIASASGFPTIGTDEYFFATIANTANTKIEVVKVTAGTTSLTVVRAQGGTSAQAFDSGDNFQLRVTADTLEAATKTDVNITGGAIAGAAITDDVIDSQHYAAGSIDLEHMSSESVDEDNLKVSNAGSNGQYLQKQSGNTGGLTWATVDTTTLLPLAGGEMTGNVNHGDNVHARFGTGNDLDIYHDGSASYIKDSGTGNLKIVTDNLHIKNAADNETKAYFDTNGAVGLYYDNGEKLVTSATGVTVSGSIAVTGTVDGRDVATDGTKLDGIATSANNYTHPNHSGEVTSTADGATVIADNIVDEANLKISNAGSNGQFLSKQTGNTGGLTWATVTMEDFIPNGTVMAFFQSSAPTGWTQVTSQNNKVLRVVSGTGGGTGGTWATSSGVTTDSQGAHTHTSAAHTHTGAAHTHTSAAHTHNGAAHSHNHNLSAGSHTLSTAQLASHSHGGVVTGGSSVGNYPGSNGGWRNWIVGLSSGSTSAAGSGSSHSHNMSGSITSGGSGATGSTTPGASGSTTPGAGGSTTPGATGSNGAHTHTITAPQYIDVIICSKDA